MTRRNLWMPLYITIEPDTDGWTLQIETGTLTIPIATYPTEAEAASELALFEGALEHRFETE